MKIVFQGKTKKGKKIIVRYPNASDVEEMLRFINKLSNEKTFIRYQGEQETLESETKYLTSRLEAIKTKKSVTFLAFYNDRLIGSTDIKRNLYKKFGFREYGILPKGVSRGGKFEDAVLMYKNI